MDFREEVRAAHRRIATYVQRTPVLFSPWLSEAAGCRVHLKLENRQHTGSFKFRGAMNRLLTLTPEQRRRGIVAASTGNHGAAVARGAAELDCPVVIFAPATASPGKLQAIRDQGVEVRCAGDDCVRAEAAARAFAVETGGCYVSPYNDPMVVAGQGTIGVELDEQLGHLDAVVVAVGGGGLIAGVGGYLHATRPGVTIVGVSPRNSAVMHASLAAGELLDLPSLPTLSDGTAGGIEVGSITFGMCQEAIDRFELVSEEAIAAALRGTVEHHGETIEGAAAAAVAGCLAAADELAGREVAVVLCGGNIDPAVLAAIR